MTWFKLDDQFPAHPKVIAAGGDAAWLFVAAGCYAAAHSTDGKVPRAILGRLTDRKNVAKLVARLIDVGLFHDLGDEVEIHDFLEYNPSKAELDSRRDSKRMAGAMGAAKRWASVCHDRGNAPDPTRPVPSTKVRRVSPPPDDFQPSETAQAFAREHGLDLSSELVGWLDWCKANGKSYKDHQAGFRTWLRNAVEFGRGRPSGPVPTIDFDVPARPEPSWCPRCADNDGWVEKADGFVLCDHQQVPA